jgi:ring-1,2-phenylacetyl-CoA epoxidase subunit PaaC
VTTHPDPAGPDPTGPEPAGPDPAHPDRAALAGYVLGLADDALVLAQRLGEWVSRAPQLEEDVALANLALDQLGQARALLTYAGEVEGAGRGEDELAYLRDEREFRNVCLVELPDEDFAVAVVRLLLFTTYQRLHYERLSASSDATLATIAARAVKEAAYHADHAREWVVRLGDGTPESHRRTADALDRLWPYVEELFTRQPADGVLVAQGIAVDVAALRPAWEAEVGAVLAQATLTRPNPSWTSRGGRRGLHTEHLGPLLAVLQHLHRSHPGASW